MQNAIPRTALTINTIPLIQKPVCQTNGKSTSSANNVRESIVEAIGLALLQSGCYFLLGQQKLLLAGCFSGKAENNAWLLQEGEVSAEQPI